MGNLNVAQPVHPMMSHYMESREDTWIGMIMRMDQFQVETMAESFVDRCYQRDARRGETIAQNSSQQLEEIKEDLLAGLGENKPGLEQYFESRYRKEFMISQEDKNFAKTQFVKLLILNQYLRDVPKLRWERKGGIMGHIQREKDKLMHRVFLKDDTLSSEILKVFSKYPILQNQNLDDNLNLLYLNLSKMLKEEYIPWEAEFYVAEEHINSQREILISIIEAEESDEVKTLCKKILLKVASLRCSAEDLLILYNLGCEDEKVPIPKGIQEMRPLTNLRELAYLPDPDPDAHNMLERKTFLTFGDKSIFCWNEETGVQIYPRDCFQQAQFKGSAPITYLNFDSCLYVWRGTQTKFPIEKYKASGGFNKIDCRSEIDDFYQTIDYEHFDNRKIIECTNKEKFSMAFLKEDLPYYRKLEHTPLFTDCRFVYIISTYVKNDHGREVFSHLEVESYDPWVWDNIGSIKLIFDLDLPGDFTDLEKHKIRNRIKELEQVLSTEKIMDCIFLITDIQYLCIVYDKVTFFFDLGTGIICPYIFTLKDPLQIYNLIEDSLDPTLYEPFPSLPYPSLLIDHSSPFPRPPSSSSCILTCLCTTFKKPSSADTNPYEIFLIPSYAQQFRPAFGPQLTKRFVNELVHALGKEEGEELGVLLRISLRLFEIIEVCEKDGSTVGCDLWAEFCSTLAKIVRVELSDNLDKEMKQDCAERINMRIVCEEIEKKLLESEDVGEAVLGAFIERYCESERDNNLPPIEVLKVVSSSKIMRKGSKFGDLKFLYEKILEYFSINKVSEIKLLDITDLNVPFEDTEHELIMYSYLEVYLIEFVLSFKKEQQRSFSEYLELKDEFSKFLLSNHLLSNFCNLTNVTTKLYQASTSSLCKACLIFRDYCCQYDYEEGLEMLSSYLETMYSLLHGVKRFLVITDAFLIANCENLPPKDFDKLLTLSKSTIELIKQMNIFLKVSNGAEKLLERNLEEVQRDEYKFTQLYLKSITWSLSRIASSFVQPHQINQNEFLEYLGEANIISGGINNKFLYIFNEAAKNEIASLAQALGENELERAITPSSTSEHYELMLAFIHQGKNKEVDLLIELLQWNSLKKNPFCKIQGEEGMVVTRCAFAASLALDRSDNVYSFDNLEVFLAQIEYMTENIDTNIPIDQQYEHYTEELKETGKFDKLIEKWEKASRMRNWLQQRSKDLSVSNTFGKNFEESKEETKDENMITELVNKKTSNDVNSIIDKVIAKAELLVKFNPPASWGNFEARKESSSTSEQENSSQNETVKLFKIRSSKATENQKRFLKNISDQSVFNSCSSSVLCILQSSITLSDIIDFMGTQFVKGLKRYYGLKIFEDLAQLCETSDNILQIFNWLNSCFSDKDNAMSHYSDGLNGAGAYLLKKLKNAYYSLFNHNVKELLNCEDEKKFPILFNNFICKIGSNDHDSILRSGILDVYSKNGEYLHNILSKSHSKELTYCSKLSDKSLEHLFTNLLEFLMDSCYLKLCSQRGRNQRIPSTQSSLNKLQQTYSVISSDATQAFLDQGIGFVFKNLSKEVEHCDRKMIRDLSGSLKFLKFLHILEKFTSLGLKSQSLSDMVLDVIQKECVRVLMSLYFTQKGKTKLLLLRIFQNLLCSGLKTKILEEEIRNCQFYKESNHEERIKTKVELDESRFLKCLYDELVLLNTQRSCNKDSIKIIELNPNFAIISLFKAMLISKKCSVYRVIIEKEIEKFTGDIHSYPLHDFVILISLCEGGSYDTLYPGVRLTTKGDEYILIGYVNSDGEIYEHSEDEETSFPLSNINVSPHPTISNKMLLCVCKSSSKYNVIDPDEQELVLKNYSRLPNPIREIFKCILPDLIKTSGSDDPVALYKKCTVLKMIVHLTQFEGVQEHEDFLDEREPLRPPSQFKLEQLGLEQSDKINVLSFLIKNYEQVDSQPNIELIISELHRYQNIGYMDSDEISCNQNFNDEAQDFTDISLKNHKARLNTCSKVERERLLFIKVEDKNLSTRYLQLLQIFYKLLTHSVTDIFLKDMDLDATFGQICQEGCASNILNLLIIRGNQAVNSQINNNDCFPMLNFIDLYKQSACYFQAHDGGKIFSTFVIESAINENLEILQKLNPQNLMTLEQYFKIVLSQNKAISITLISDLVSILLQEAPDIIRTPDILLPLLEGLLEIILSIQETEIICNLTFIVLKLLYPFTQKQEEYADRETIRNLLCLEPIKKQLKQFSNNGITTLSQLQIKDKAMIEILWFIRNIEIKHSDISSSYKYTGTLYDIFKGIQILSEPHDFEMQYYSKYIEDCIKKGLIGSTIIDLNVHSPSSKIKFDNEKVYSGRIKRYPTCTSLKDLNFCRDIECQEILNAVFKDSVRSKKDTYIIPSESFYCKTEVSPNTVVYFGGIDSVRTSSNDSNQYDHFYTANPVCIQGLSTKIRAIKNSGGRILLMDDEGGLFKSIAPSGYFNRFKDFHKATKYGYKFRDIKICEQTHAILKDKNQFVFYEIKNSSFYLADLIIKSGSYDMKLESDDSLLHWDVGLDYLIYTTRKGQCHVLLKNGAILSENSRLINSKFKQITFDEGIIPLKPYGCSFRGEDRTRICIFLVDNNGRKELWSAGSGESFILAQAPNICWSTKPAPMDYDKEEIQIKDASIYSDWGMAITDDGQVYGWGNNTHKAFGKKEENYYYKLIKLDIFDNYIVHEVKCGLMMALVIASPKANPNITQVLATGKIIGVDTSNANDDGVLHLSMFDNKPIKSIDITNMTCFIILDEEKLDHNIESLSIHHGYTCEITKKSPIVGTMLFWKQDQEWKYLSPEGYEEIKNHEGFIPEICYVTNHYIENISEKEFPDISLNEFLDLESSSNLSPYFVPCNKYSLGNQIREDQIIEEDIHDYLKEKYGLFYRLSKPLQFGKILPKLDLRTIFEDYDTNHLQIELWPDHSYEINQQVLELDRGLYESQNKSRAQFTPEISKDFQKAVDKLYLPHTDDEAYHDTAKFEDLIFESEELKIIDKADLDTRRDFLVNYGNILKDLNSIALPGKFMPRLHQDIKSLSITHIISSAKTNVLQWTKHCFLSKLVAKTSTVKRKVRVRLNRRKIFDRKNSGEVDDQGCWTIFGEIMKEIQKYDYNPLKTNSHESAWDIVFQEEFSEDAGGPYRVSIDNMLDEIHSTCLPLLIPTPNNSNDHGVGRELWTVNPSARSSHHTKMFEFMGALIGMALRSGQTMDFKLPTFFWKCLNQDETFTMEDLLHFDAYAYQALRDIEKIKSELSKEEFEKDMHLNWTTQASNGETIVLCPEGESKQVLYEHTQKYCQEVLKARAEEGQIQIESIRNGFNKIFDIDSLEFFQSSDIEAFVRGPLEISSEDLKSCVKYYGCDSQNEFIQRFWKVFETFTTKERSQFLKFVWGRSSLPSVAKMSNVIFHIELNRRDIDPDTLLPTSQTCFFRLILPQYTSDWICNERIKFAIENCEDIDLDEAYSG